MPFPDYVPTRGVSVGGAMVLESAQLLRVRVTITASKSLVWDETGYRFERLKVSSTSELGSEVVVLLPRTDVQGWKDAATGQIIDVSAEGSYTHRYTALVEFLNEVGVAAGIPPVTLGPFVVPDGVGVIDLDKTVPSSTVAGDSISIPDWWGVLVTEAQQAAAEAAAAVVDSDQFIGTQISTPGTRSSDAVTEKVAAVVAEDPEVADAVAERVLATEGVVTGARTGEATGVGWALTTELGHLLLAFAEDGKLHPATVSRFLAELWSATDRPDHPDWAHLILGSNNELLFGIRRDGTIEAPGLAGGGGGRASGIVADMPFTVGSDVAPAYSDLSKWSGWGSSSLWGLASRMASLASAHDATYYNGSQGGEAARHVFARLGATPALLTLPGNAMPTSGAVDVTASNMSTSTAMQSFTGTILGVEFTLSVSTSPTRLTLTRTTPGAATPVPPNTPFIPVEGPKHSADLVFLWAGKNDLVTGVTGDVVADRTDAAFDWLAPAVKRAIVIGHFVNPGTPEASPVRTQTAIANARHLARYGALFVPTTPWLTGSDVWTQTGITPTSDDLAQQAIGNAPLSLVPDGSHFNAATNDAFIQHVLTPALTAVNYI